MRHQLGRPRSSAPEQLVTYVDWHIEFCHFLDAGGDTPSNCRARGVARRDQGVALSRGFLASAIR